MEIGINVNGSNKGLQRPEAGSRVPAQRGSLVKIGLLLKDALKVLGEDGEEVTMSQSCYEQNIFSMYSSQVDDLDYVKQLAFTTLQDNMHMDPQAAEMAKTEVATTIRDLVRPTRETNPSRWTVLLEIHVECSIKKAGSEPGGPSGPHGYDQLVRSHDDEECGICHNEFSLPSDIVITTCHHIYHRSCLFRWLYRGSYSCPICRADVSPIVGGSINF